MRHKRGFTLIELLVVISIIAMLLAVLMPTLHRVRLQAQKVVCTSNLKQLSIGMQVYCQSNDDNTIYNLQVGGHFWFHNIAPYLGAKGYKRAAEDTEKDEANPFLERGMGVLFCPVTKKTKDEWDNEGYFRKVGTATNRWAFYSSEGSYGISTWVTSNNISAQRRYPGYTYMKLIQTKANTPLFADCTHLSSLPLDTDPGPDNNKIINGPGDGGANLMWRYTIDRHNRAINVALADGHVENVHLQSLWSLKWHRRFQTEDKKDFPYVTSWR